MTTEQDINRQVDELYNKFWNSPYEGRMPANIVSKFREAIMFQTPKTLQSAPAILRELLEAKEYDLKFVHVGIIINTLYNSPLNTIFYSPEEAMDALVEFIEIEHEYNKIVQKRAGEIEKAREKKMEICGLTPKTISMNGSNHKN